MALDKSYWEKRTHEECVAEIYKLQRDVISDWQYREVMKRQEDEIARLRSALADMHSGWLYIREHHGDLYGVGWDRCQAAAEAALKL
jgi:hypothetical protein